MYIVNHIEQRVDKWLVHVLADAASELGNDGAGSDWAPGSMALVFDSDSTAHAYMLSPSQEWKALNGGDAVSGGDS